MYHQTQAAALRFIELRIAAFALAMEMKPCP